MEFVIVMTSHRIAVAEALVTLIRQRLMASRSNVILRTSLHASVPVSERPDVRRGLDGLVEHGVLAQSGEYIGFTAKGRLFLSYLHQQRGSPSVRHELDDEGTKTIAALLREIDEDARFEPYGNVEAVESLPARLEAQLAPRKPLVNTRMLVLAFLLVLAALLYALRL
jgi:hypothetical protein